MRVCLINEEGGSINETGVSQGKASAEKEKELFQY